MAFPLLIPIIIGAGSAFTAGYGIKKGYDGISDINQAKDIARNALERGQKAEAMVDNKKNQTNTKACEYADNIMHVQQTTFNRFLDLVSRFGHNGSLELDRILREVEVDPIVIDDLKVSAIKAHNVATGALSMGTSALGAASGTKLLIGLFGTASTGTSISGLSGAAATKATMAWLGGGSVAAGGGGMALGTVVLGGLTAAPALLVGGFVLAKRGSEAMVEARSYEASVNIEISRLNAISAFLNRLMVRISELNTLIINIDLRVNSTLDMIDPENFDVKNTMHIQLFQQAAVQLKALAEIIKTPVLDNNGNITEASRSIKFKYQKMGG
ncbi:hypothetical protein [Desulfonatronovibrio magnus]|uniref:hypothetical protein n=1 Tax=Desulfonatronovibrio magnus TaxID=698827 RepID=UPI0005EBDB30|nr:hypothetical protein [Desulfonatronovibrio magnus]